MRRSNPTSLFSARRRGTAAEHALLLACLFLGFHLEAYVVLGEVDGEKSYSVLTVEQAEGWIWDPCSGTRKSWGEPTAGLWIHTVFNNEGCWTPRQRDARPSTIGFRVRDPQWGSLPEEVVALPSLHLYPRDFSLQAWPPSLTEEQAEQGVAQGLTAMRQGLGLRTEWEPRLRPALGMALSSYELQRAVGAQYGQSTFESIIKQFCRDGAVFQGFPIQFNHTRTDAYFPALLQQKVCRDMAAVATARFAVRAHIVPYPEDVLAVWVIIASLS